MTNQAPHTPTPWKIQQESIDPEWHIVTSLGGRIIANVHIEAGNRMDEANAKLLMAAGSMYEAGKPFVEASNLFEVIDDGGGERYVVTVTKDEYIALKTAIAQAEGQ